MRTVLIAGLLVLAGCGGPAFLVDAEQPASASNLVFLITSSDPAGDPEPVRDLVVKPCGSGKPIVNRLWTLRTRGRGLVPPVRIRYGVPPDGFYSMHGPKPLEPGCFTVGLNRGGEEGWGGSTILVDSSYSVTIDRWLPDPDGERRSLRQGRLMAVIIFPLLGLPLAVWGAHLVRRGSATHRWVETSGRALHMYVHRDRPDSVWEIKYQYTVGGKSYRSRRLGFGRRPPIPLGFRRTFLGEISPSPQNPFIPYHDPLASRRDALLVYYDPADPREAVLAPGVGAWSIGILLVGNGLLALTVYAAITLAR